MAPEGNEGVGGNEPVGGAASGSTAATGTPASTGSAGATGSGSPTPAPKWDEDPRAKGLIADLQRERKARQDYERRVAEVEARAAERDRQIAALTNTRTPTKDEAEVEAVKARFNELFPHLGSLTPEQIEKLLAVAERGEQLDQTNTHYWTNHGRRMLDSVHTEIGKELGDLSDRQKKRINAAYVQEAENDPNFLTRHEAGDPTLVAEFVKNYLEDFVEPVRRKITQSEVSRQRPVPFGKDRSIPGQGDRKIDVNDPKAVMDLIVESRKGKFGRQ